MVCWNRWSVHKVAAGRLAGRKGFDFGSLPVYGPELKPVEVMWSHTKYGNLANFVPADVDGLAGSVRHSLYSQSQDQHSKKSSFKLPNSI